MNMREERQETNSAERGMIMITGGMKEEEIGIMIGIDYVLLSFGVHINYLTNALSRFASYLRRLYLVLNCIIPLIAFEITCQIKLRLKMLKL